METSKRPSKETIWRLLTQQIHNETLSSRDSPSLLLVLYTHCIRVGLPGDNGQIKNLFKLEAILVEF